MLGHEVPDSRPGIIGQHSVANNAQINEWITEHPPAPFLMNVPNPDFKNMFNMTKVHTILSHLMRSHQQVPGDNSCFWHSLKLGMDVPTSFSTMQFKRWIICLIAQHHDVVFKDDILKSLRGVYFPHINGEEMEPHACPALPQDFTLKEYLKFHLRSDTWVDAIILSATALVLNIKLTILSVNEEGDCSIQNFRHQDMHEADVILGFNSKAGHYSGTGTFTP